VPYAANPYESLLGLAAGEVVSARDLAYALILASANDGAVAAATAIDGSIDAFVVRMNEAAAALDLTETSYANPIGFDDPDNHSSASDLAALTRVLFENDLFRQIADAESHVVETDQREIPIETRNTLLQQVRWVDGVKTGYTLEADNVLVASGTRNGRAVISVLLGSPDEASRDGDSLALLRHGFAVLREAESESEPAVEEPDVEAEPEPATVPVDPLADDGGPPLVPIALTVAAVILIAAAIRRRREAGR
jgi:D-alanyl-D-alanine carboxypeptidase (penicillin-binding protein 5/6)